MKKILLLISGLIITLQVLAQDCTKYLYLQKDKTIEMTGYNKKGDVTMKSVSKVSNVNTSGGVTTANVVSQVYDKNGKLLGTSSVDYKCNGGTVSMQMHIEAGQQSKQPTTMNFNMSGDANGEYPQNMQVGDHLPDHTSQMQMANGMTTTIKVTDRMVAAKESVTTPAGTWDCFKITYKTSSSTAFNKGGSDSTSAATSPLAKLGLKMPSSTSESTIWVAAGVGMIKSETKNSVLELTAIR
ncbi:MAG TPA: hypothetical protein VFE53_21575 [Mucilaginibacter sp.]|nr:hypothetical protein [Mucilaginibacter sp.]